MAVARGYPAVDKGGPAVGPGVNPADLAGGYPVLSSVFAILIVTNSVSLATSAGSLSSLQLDWVNSNLMLLHLRLAMQHCPELGSSFPN